MSALDVRMRSTGTGRVATRFLRMSAAANDMRPVWRRFARILAEHNERAFNTLGASNRRGWRPLSARTQAWKTANGFYGPPLVRTGEMRQAMTTASRLLRYSGRNMAYFEVQSDIYQYHHFGTRYMPQRRVMVMTRSLREKLATATHDHIVRNARPGVAPA